MNLKESNKTKIVILGLMALGFPDNFSRILELEKEGKSDDVIAHELDETIRRVKNTIKIIDEMGKSGSATPTVHSGKPGMEMH